MTSSSFAGCGGSHAFYNARAMLTTAGVPLPLFATLLLFGFLIGSVPTSVWIGRLAGGVDVRRLGSRNPGAANVWRTVGRRYGVLVGAVDAAKGALVVWIAWALGLPDHQAVWAGAAAVAGHNFSPFLGFRGGKGGATTVGMLACFLFPELLVVLAIWILGCLIFPRRKFVVSIVALSLLPALALMTGWPGLPLLGGRTTREPSVIMAAAVLMVLLWIRVAPGLVRAREESRG